jgi:glucose/mannose-6-phosphate isomerase
MQNYKTLIKKYDKSGMLTLLHSFPEQCELALEIAWRYPLHLKKKTYENIFIQGMGGSGIGGMIVKDLLQNICKVPIAVNNDYALPEFVGEKTLAFFVSYSGNTEETLTCFRKARARKASIVCISSDGKLAKMCKSCIRVPQGNPPRTMLGFLSLPLLVTIARMQLLKKPLALNSLPRFLKRELSDAEKTGKKLAKNLYGKIPVIYAASPYQALALRFHTQLAENSGQFSHWNVLPEANHNEIVGFKPNEKNLAFVFFRSKDESVRMQKRFAFTKKLVSKMSESTEIWLKGKTHAERLFHGILIGDFASYYLALLNGKDPSDIKNINALKKTLSR